MPDIAILAWGSVSDDVDARHVARFGRAFRRISRYVKLAQVGSMACLDTLAPADRAALDPRRVGVFLGSGLGNTADIVPLSEGILHPTRPWASPMAFAGCVGNAAAFHVARTLSLEGPNVTVSQEELSFEGALLDARLALRAGTVDHALVGGVDVRTGNDSEQRERMGALTTPGQVGEGTGWVLLGAGTNARAWLEDVWIGAASAETLLDAGDARVLPGWRLQGACGHNTAPAETRLVPVATALRMVDVLSGAEAVPRPGAVAFVQRTPHGQGARVRLRLA